MYKDNSGEIAAVMHKINILYINRTLSESAKSLKKAFLCAFG